MTAELAAGRLHFGIQRLLSSYPLLGGMVAAWKIVSGSTPTMAIGFGGLEFRLYYNQTFVMSITLDELVGVLHHEARHVIYGHLFMKAADFPDENALLIATEVTVNEGIPEPLPGKPILLKHFPKLPPDETTVQRYRRLEKPKEGKPGTGTGPTGNFSPADGDGDDAGGTGVALSPKPGTGDQSKAGKKPSPATRGRPVDDHSHWAEVQQHQEVAEVALLTTIAQVVSNLETVSPYERRCLSQGPGRGLDPGNSSSKLKGTGQEPQVPWQQVLHAYLGRVRQTDYTYMRAPRRMQHLLGVVPGTRRRARRPRLQVVIDSSGSISDQDLEDIVAELNVLGRSNDVIVVECDSRIHRVYRYSGRIETIDGRGGTSFILPLEDVFLRKTQADVVVFFTDLDGLFPEVPPQVPVIWVVVRGRTGEAPWGRVVRMDGKPS